MIFGKEWSAGTTAEVTDSRLHPYPEDLRHVG